MSIRQQNNQLSVKSVFSVWVSIRATCTCKPLSILSRLYVVRTIYLISISSILHGSFSILYMHRVIYCCLPSMIEEGNPLPAYLLSV